MRRNAEARRNDCVGDMVRSMLRPYEEQRENESRRGGCYPSSRRTLLRMTGLVCLLVELEYLGARMEADGLSVVDEVAGHAGRQG